MSEDEKLVNAISAALYKWRYGQEWPPATTGMRQRYENKARFIADEIIPVIEEAKHGAASVARWGVMTPDDMRKRLDLGD